jgi:hypothetical protein
MQAARQVQTSIKRAQQVGKQSAKITPTKSPFKTKGRGAIPLNVPTCAVVH